jgi:hypothetical protein
VARLNDGSDRRREHREGTDRRGQMILITGFALAVAFVTLALVLNSVVFTGNLATSSESAAASEAITYRADVTTGAERVIAFVNEHNTSSYSELNASLEADMDNVSNLLLRHRITEGEVVDGQVDARFRGTWIKQTNSSRNFTNVGGDTKWTLFANSNGARSFRIHVTDDTSLQLLNNDPFNVTARDGASEWRLNVTDAASGSKVFVRRADGSEIECDVPVLSDFWINVSEGTVAGNECEGLAFGDQLGTITSVEYGNADNIEGTYRLMTNKSKGSVGSSDYSATDSPFTEPAVYGLRLNVTYESDRVEYETDPKVIPGETE